jgi:acyl-CoA reductase-like NAD-dependent aldehyde dehydrogenase
MSTTANGDEVDVVTNFVDGASESSADSTMVEGINPSNGRREIAIPAGSAHDVQRAVLSARKTFEGGSWSAAPPSFRKAILHRFADLIAAAAQELDALDALDMGKPVSTQFYSERTGEERTRCASMQRPSIRSRATCIQATDSVSYYSVVYLEG